MPKREDGKETRLKLLKSACKVFAQKGFRGAKIADICNHAGANVASVNYYFGDKTNLYREAWCYAIEQLNASYISTTTGDTPIERLKSMIESLLSSMGNEDIVSYFSKLYLKELSNPTGLIQDAWRDMVEPKRRKFHSIVKEVIGDDVDDFIIACCELNIINMCRALVTHSKDDLEFFLDKPLNESTIKKLGLCIADFSIGGIMAFTSKKY